MPTEMREQIRELAAAFDAFVVDVTVDEAIGRVEQPAAPDELVMRRSALSRGTSRVGWPRRGVTVAAAVLVVGLVAALVSRVDQGGSGPVSAPSIPAATAGSVASVPLGQFVWPAPPRGFETTEDLVSAFAIEVLRWTAFDIDGGAKDERVPQRFNLSNSTLDASVPVIAVPSADGWGFVQIGFGLDVSLLDDTVILEFPTLPSVTSSSITVRLSNGTVIETTATTDRVEIGGIQLEELLSALVIGHDSDGNAIVVTGGQFTADDPAVPATTPADLQTTTTQTAQDSTVPTTESVPRLTHPVIDLDGCTPTWSAETPATSLDRAYILGGTDPFALQVFTTASGSLADQFAVVGRQFTNQRFNDSAANTEVNGQLARATFGEAGSVRERWGDLIWRLPDGSEAYLRTSTMTQAEVLALAASLQPRPADSSIPGFDTTHDSFILMDETMTPFDVGPTIDSACEFTTGGWLRVSILPGTSVGDAIFLTDRPFETRGATTQLDDQRIVTVSGRDDVSQRSTEALATVRQADDNEWQLLTQADPTDFEPNQPPP